jgi:hypothetical protein
MLIFDGQSDNFSHSKYSNSCPVCGVMMTDIEKHYRWHKISPDQIMETGFDEPNVFDGNRENV